MSNAGLSQIKQVKEAAYLAGASITDEEAEQSIAEYFDPSLPPPELSAEELRAIVESFLGEDSN
jgi:hypothetical protein